MEKLYGFRDGGSGEYTALHRVGKEGRVAFESSAQNFVNSAWVFATKGQKDTHLVMVLARTKVCRLDAYNTQDFANISRTWENSGS